MKLKVIRLLLLSTAVVLLVACGGYDYKLEEPIGSLLPKCEYFDPLFGSGDDTTGFGFRRCYGSGNSFYIMHLELYDGGSDSNAKGALEKLADQYEVRVRLLQNRVDNHHKNGRLGDAKIDFVTSHLESDINSCGTHRDDLPGIEYGRRFVLGKWLGKITLTDCNHSFENFNEITMPSYCEFAARIGDDRFFYHCPTDRPERNILDIANAEIVSRIRQLGGP